MTEKRQEFLDRIKYKAEEKEDLSNIVFAAKLEQRMAHQTNRKVVTKVPENKKQETVEHNNLQDMGSVFLAYKVEAEFQRRKEQKESKDEHTLFE